MPDPPNELWPSRPPPEPPWLPYGAVLAPAPPQGPPPPGPPPPRPDRRAFVGAVIAAAAVTILLGAVLAVAARPDEPETAAPPRSTAPRPTAPPPIAPPAPSGSTADPAVVAAELLPLRRFVERTRAQAFSDDVDVEVLDADAFRQAVLAEVDKSADDVAQDGRLLRAGGLVPPAYDVLAGERQLLGDGVLGFYVPETGRLVVRGGASFTPFLRVILVHELTHALDDQHFELHRPHLDAADDDRAWAFAALVEGSARWVEQRYLESLPNAERDAYEREALATAMGSTGGSDAPLVLQQMLSSPYEFGQGFVTDVVDRGGTPALDDAFRRPPATSEHVADVARFRRGEPAVAVTAPPPEGRTLDEGTLGQVMTGFLLHGAELNGLSALIDPVDPNELSELLDRFSSGGGDLEDLLEALSGGAGGLGSVTTPSGWGGDRYVVYEPEGGGVCVRVDWRMDTAEDLGRLTTDLRRWATADTRVQISQPGADVVRATRCAPPP